MEKYGVEQPLTKTANVSTTSPKVSPKCPDCNSEVIRKGSVWWCPNCGTKPFEGEIDAEEK